MSSVKGSITSAVRSGNKLRLLRAQRTRIANELDLIPLGGNPGAVATLSRQLIAVCDKIAEVEGANATQAKGGIFDELAKRRAERDRQSKAS